MYDALVLSHRRFADDVYFERCNTDTTLTNLLAGREQKKKTKRLLNLKEYDVVSTLKKNSTNIYIHTAPSANQNITDVFCRRYRNKIDLD
jgi:succinylglutamate desuccinylase